MPVLQLARPSIQLASTQPVTGTSDKPLHKSTTGATSQYPDSDLEAHPTSPVCPLEEEGEVSEETSVSEQDPDQQISEEQTTRKWSEE